MNKVERNEPCHCRSGRKYKKCHLAADEAKATEQRELAAKQRAARSEEAERASRRLSEELRAQASASLRDAARERLRNRLSPYAFAKETEDELAQHWTPARVAALSTEAIFAQLEAFGVHSSPESFQPLTEGRWSAWSIADEWRAKGQATCAKDDEPFLGLASCELWKRLVTGRPSGEQLDDWIDEGYALLDERKVGAGCERWLEVWRVLLARLPETTRRMHDTQPFLPGRHLALNWCQDLEMELGNSAIDEPRFATLGLEYCDAWLARFPDDGELVQVPFRSARGTFLLRLGERDQAEAEFLSIIARWPHRAGGYVALADALSEQHDPGARLPLDSARAKSVLRQALERATDGDEWDLEERLQALDVGAPIGDQGQLSER